MIRKIYEVTCDNCYELIGRYFNYKPSLTELRKKAGYVRINNGAVLVVCESCAKNPTKKYGPKIAAVITNKKD